MKKWKLSKRKKQKAPHNDLQVHIEQAIYNVYWRWSMIIYIFFNDAARAQEVMNVTVKKVDKYEKVARKVILKIFSDLSASPEKEIDKFITYSLRQETAAEENKDYVQTKKLLEHLLMRNLISTADYEQWLKKITYIDRCEDTP